MAQNPFDQFRTYALTERQKCVEDKVIPLI